MTLLGTRPTAFFFTALLLAVCWSAGATTAMAAGGSFPAPQDAGMTCGETSCTMPGPSAAAPVGVATGTAGGTSRSGPLERFTAGATASMLNPTPYTRLSGNTVTFGWQAAPGALQYLIRVGTTPAGIEVNYTYTGLVTAATVTNVPVDGRAIYVRLYTQLGNGWQYLDYTYTAASGAGPAALLTPTPYTTLPGSSATFTWHPAGGAEQYLIRVGTTPGGSEIAAGYTGLQTSATVTGIPTNGSTIHVRLYTQIAGGWDYLDYSFTAAH